MMIMLPCLDRALGHTMFAFIKTQQKNINYLCISSYINSASVEIQI